MSFNHGRVKLDGQGHKLWSQDETSSFLTESKVRKTSSGFIAEKKTLTENYKQVTLVAVVGVTIDKHF